MPADSVEQGYDEIRWCPIELIDLKHLKEAMISYGMCLSYVKQILNDLVTQYFPRPEGIGNSYNRDWSTVVMVSMVEGRGLEY